MPKYELPLEKARRKARENAERVKDQIASSPRMRELQRQAGQAAAVKRQEARERFDSNTEVQRKGRLSKDELSREAVEIMVPKVKEYNDFKAGRDTTEAEARKKVEEIAERATRGK